MESNKNNNETAVQSIVVNELESAILWNNEQWTLCTAKEQRLKERERENEWNVNIYIHNHRYFVSFQPFYGPLCNHINAKFMAFCTRRVTAIKYSLTIKQKKTNPLYDLLAVCFHNTFCFIHRFHFGDHIDKHCIISLAMWHWKVGTFNVFVRVCVCVFLSCENAIMDSGPVCFKCVVVEMRKIQNGMEWTDFNSSSRNVCVYINSVTIKFAVDSSDMRQQCNEHWIPFSEWHFFFRW